MTPHRSNGRGSFVLDRVVKGVGRIRVSSGTNHAPTFRRLNEMLDGLYDRGRLDLLRAIMSRKLSPLQVYDAYRVGELDRLPTVEMLVPLADTFETWAKAYECGERHREGLLTAARHIRAAAPNGATVAHLVEIVRGLRVAMKETARAFNMLRSAAQAFARENYGQASKMWAELTAIAPLKVTATRVKHPATVAELLAITSRMATTMERDLKTVPCDFAGMAWTLALTGMRTDVEYFARDYSEKKDWLEVATAKREREVRRVPLVRPIVDPQCWYGAFRKELHRVTGGQMTPYDLRRTFANWLEAAGITRTRRRLYMGHGALDTTGLYEWHEVKAFLADDTAKLRAWLDAELAQAQPKPQLRLESK